MAVGFELAVVLRAKGGVNFLMHTQGIGAKDVNEAAKETLDALANFAETGGRGHLANSGDCSPGFAAGHLRVPRGRRLQVTYRLVNAVWVLVVSSAGANTALCAQVVDCTVRLLVAACKGVDVTPDRVARRYPEIYLATGQLLSPGGLSVSSIRLLASAEAEVASISPDAAAKPRGPSATIKSRLGVGSKKIMGSSASSASLSQSSPDPSQSGPRSLSGEGSQPAWAPFALPADAVRGLSPAAPSPSRDLEGMLDPAAALDDLLGPAVPVQGAESLAGTGLETLEPPVTDYAHRFSNLRRPPPPPAALDSVWAAFSSQTPLEPGGATTGDSSAQLQPKAALPPPTSKQQKAISNGNALQLVELWRASYVGWQLEAAGTSGEVIGTGAVPRCSATAVFRLSRGLDAQPQSTTSLAKAARGEPEVTSSTGQPAMTALFGKVSGAEVPFLRYQLPAVGVQPPLLLAIAAAPSVRQPVWQSSKLTSVSDEMQGSQLGPEGKHADSPSERAPAAGSTASAASDEVVSSPSARAAGSTLPAATASDQVSEATHARAHNSSEEMPEADVAPATAVPADPPSRLLVVQLAASPALQGPLRGVCLDVDIHPSLGQLLAASTDAQWCQSRRRLRWHLYTISPGSKLRLHATFQAAELASGIRHSVAHATIRAFGSAGEGLSGISLQSGASEGSLKESRRAFYCEVYARTAAVHTSKSRIIEKTICCLEARAIRNDSKPTEENQMPGPEL